MLDSRAKKTKDLLLNRLSGDQQRRVTRSDSIDWLNRSQKTTILIVLDHGLTRMADRKMAMPSDSRGTSCEGNARRPHEINGESKS